MDFDQYVAARYGRLIEHAVLLGCAEGEAGTYVDRVLLEQRKRIRRAEDPDPLVRAALEQALGGERPSTRSTGPFVAIGVLAVVVVVAVALTYRPRSEPMPTLFGLDGDQAQARLQKSGLEVVLRPARACEPAGLVIGSDPRPGDLVQEGATVSVRTAVPSGVFCDAQYPDRSDAWRFVRFALGGTPPEFADLVHVIVDRSDDATLTHADAVRQDRWGGTLEQVADQARLVVGTQSHMPTLVVSSGVPPATWCGVPRPPQGGERQALRLEIDPRPDGERQGCPLTVDLYRSIDGVIDSVVLYTPKDLDADVAAD